MAGLRSGQVEQALWVVPWQPYQWLSGKHEGNGMFLTVLVLFFGSVFSKSIVALLAISVF